MKNYFYVHGTNELVNLYDNAEPLKNDWSNRFNVTYQESVIYHEIYNRKDYFRKVCNIEPGDVVVDCGGNIGIFTSFAFDHGASRVLSFEPHHSNYLLNKKNNPNAEVFNLAVSNHSNEEVELIFSENSSGGHTIMQNILDNKTSMFSHYEKKSVFIKTINLNDIIKNNSLEKIDFLKIDTEGAEMMIMEGISDENLNKIRCISIEYHHSVFNFDEEIYSNFLRRFTKLGFNTHTMLMGKHTRMTYICKGEI